MKNVDILQIDNSWHEVLNSYFSSKDFTKTITLLKHEMKVNIVYPKIENVLKAYNSTPFDKVKVVLLGQDCYHGEKQAHGLAFSVQKWVKIPPSLQNIFKELQTDLGLDIPSQGNLQSWANQGVLLLNSFLTVKKGEPLSHSHIGWQILTDLTISEISKQKKGVVFLLWGNHAQEKEKLIDKKKHHILKTTHPSPFSANKGFLGCKHFSKTNELLIKHGLEPIDWQITF